MSGLSNLKMASRVNKDAVVDNLIKAGAVKLNNILCDKEEQEIVLEEGTFYIQSSIPIETGICKSLTIKGVPGKTELFLISTESMMPCIGSKTSTGLSFGRWSMEPCNLEELVLLDITVHAYSLVENFSLGSYSYEDTPTIVLNNAVYNGPEGTGKRFVVERTDNNPSSTKHSHPIIFGIKKNDESVYDALPEELRKDVDFILDYYPNIKNKLSLDTSDRVYKAIINAINVGVIPSEKYILELLKYSDSAERIIVNAAVMLELPVKCIRGQEFLFECGKFEYLVWKYFGCTEDDLLIDGKINPCEVIVTIMDRIGHTSEKEIAICYDMIPAYNWNFSGTKEDNVNTFYETYKYAIDIYKSKLI